MMNAGHVFVKPKVQGNKAVLCGKGDARFCILGSSVPLSDDQRGPRPNIARLGSVQLDLSSITKDKEGVIAVVANYHLGGKHSLNANFLIPIRMGEEGIEVDLESAFFPVSKTGSMGQIYPIGEYVDDSGSSFFLKVTVGDEIFTTNNIDLTGRYVSDADLLCRFMVGQATLEEVQDAAREAEEEISAQEQVDQLRKQLSDVIAEFSKKGERITELEGIFAAAREEYIQSGKSLKSLRKSVEAYLKSQFFSGFRNSRPSNERRDLLQEIAEEQGVDSAA